MRTISRSVGAGSAGGGQCPRDADMQRFDLLPGEHLRGRPIRVCAGQGGHMHQAHADDAKEGQIALQAAGLLEQAVLDLAAGLQHLALPAV